MNICRVLHPFHTKEIKDTDIDTAVQSISDPLEMFIYLYRKEVFLNNSLFIVHLIANKMLIQTEHKMLIIPVERFDNFQQLLSNADNSKLHTFLTTCITEV